MRLPLALAALALPAAAWAQDVPEGLVRHYTCAGGAHLAAAYINAPAATPTPSSSSTAAMTPMQAGPTGSGVRYLSLDASRLVWHTKGDAGFLAHDDADQTMLANDCTARQP